MVVEEPDKIEMVDDDAECLAQSETRMGLELDFAHIMNTIGHGVLVTDEAWRFEYVNPAFARIVGMPIADLIGRSMDDFIIPEDRQLLVQQRSWRLSGKTTTYDFRLRRSESRG